MTIARAIGRPVAQPISGQAGNGQPPEPIDLIINGDFASDTVWLKGTGWSIAGGVATKSAGTLSYLSQPINSPAGRYLVIFDVITRTAGGVLCRVNAIQTTNRLAVGHYEQEITVPTAGLEFSVQGNAVFAGSVDNVKLFYLGP